MHDYNKMCFIETKKKIKSALAVQMAFSSADLPPRACSFKKV